MGIVYHLVEGVWQYLNTLSRVERHLTNFFLYGNGNSLNKVKTHLDESLNMLDLIHFSKDEIDELSEEEYRKKSNFLQNVVGTLSEISSVSENDNELLLDKLFELRLLIVDGYSTFTDLVKKQSPDKIGDCTSNIKGTIQSFLDTKKRRTQVKEKYDGGDWLGPDRGAELRLYLDSDIEIETEQKIIPKLEEILINADSQG
jgi:hypothetical protein